MAINHLILLLSLVAVALGVRTFTDWHQYNANLLNDRHVSSLRLNKNSIQNMAHKCDILFTSSTTDKSRYQSQPILVDDVLYVSGNAGFIKAIRINKGGCEELWSFNVRDEVFGLTGQNIQARVTPAYYEQSLNSVAKKGKLISIGPGFSLALSFFDWFTTPFYIFQIDAETGQLDWKLNLTAPTNQNIEEALMSS